MPLSETRNMIGISIMISEMKTGWISGYNIVNMVNSLKIMNKNGGK